MYLTTKESILAALEAQRGESVSGAALAETLGISRAAVWKAVQSLQAEGIPLTGTAGKGYLLAKEANVLTAQGIYALLHDAKDALQITVQRSVTSTNTLLKTAAENGAPEGTVLIAEEQTAGRGRRGRSFYSPIGTGVYISLVLRPHMAAQDSLFITTAAAVAVAKAIDAVAGCHTGIKWVNDIYLNGKKLCGILTEAALDMESGSLSYAVLGIGINLLAPPNGFPPELENIAGSIFAAEDSLPPNARCSLCAAVLENFWQEYCRLSEKAFLAEYKARSFLTGQDVLVLHGESATPAKAICIDDDCHLVVQYADGRTQAMDSGEVSVRAQSK